MTDLEPKKFQVLKGNWYPMNGLESKKFQIINNFLEKKEKIQNQYQIQMA